MLGLIIAFLWIVIDNSVRKRKESYLSVFFQIGENVIRRSLRKCEEFAKKVAYEQHNLYLSVFGNEDQDELEQQDLIKMENNSNDRFRQNNISILNI